MTFAEKVIHFNRQLDFSGTKLPRGIEIMNPFTSSAPALEASERFYRTYYNDEDKRHLILGINPGRHGAGITGIPFTDPKRLAGECHIHYPGKITHEPSSVFVYEVIKSYGDVDLFYKHFFINSVFPLGFISVDTKGRQKNYNYYDSSELIAAVRDLIIQNLKNLLDLGIDTDTCFCLGTGKNEKFLNKINDEYHFFKKIIPLEHPRFVMQYKSTQKDIFIEKYLSALKAVH